MVFGAKAIVLATGGIGRAYSITSNSWEGTGDGHALAYRAGADLIDMEFVQFHPTGMVWPPSVQGILVTEGVRGEGGVLRNASGERFMFVGHPCELSGADRRQRRGRLALYAGRRTRGGRRSCSPAITSPAASSARSRRAVAARTAACSSTSRGSRRGCRTRRNTSAASCRACTTSSSSSPTSTSPRSRWRSARRRTTSWAGCTSTPTRRCRSVPGLFAAGECACRHQRRQSARWQLALGHRRLRQTRGRVRRRVRPDERGRGHRRRPGRRGASGSRWLPSSAAQAARTPSRCNRICRR